MLRADALRHIIHAVAQSQQRCSADQGRSFLGGVSVVKTQDASQRDVVIETSAKALPQCIRSPLVSERAHLVEGVI